MKAAARRTGVMVLSLLTACIAPRWEPATVPTGPKRFGGAGVRITTPARRIVAHEASSDGHIIRGRADDGRPFEIPLAQIERVEVVGYGFSWLTTSVTALFVFAIAFGRYAGGGGP